MNNWTVELSKPIARGQAWTQSVTVEGMEYHLALVKGLDELFHWCGEEARANPDAPVSQQAVDYWHECRASGGMQLYEIQTELDNRYGISFIIKPIEEVAPPSARPSHNGKPAAPVDAEPAKQPGIRDILKERMAILQAHEKQLLQQITRLQDEYDDVREDLREVTTLLTTLGVKAKRRRTKANAEN